MLRLSSATIGLRVLGIVLGIDPLEEFSLVDQNAPAYALDNAIKPIRFSVKN